MTTIGERVAAVRLALGNRADLDARISEWIKQAYVELAMSFEFEDMETIVEDTVSYNEDCYSYPTDEYGVQVRAVKSITAKLDDGSPIPLRKKDFTYIQRQTASSLGTPAMYATRGKSLYIRPVPDKTYNVIWSVLRKPYINTILNSTILEVPDDWLEIIDKSATMRGFADLNEADKAGGLMMLLYGSEDPRTGRRFPGILTQRKLARIIESSDDDFGVDPRLRRYSQ